MRVRFGIGLAVAGLCVWAAPPAPAAEANPYLPPFTQVVMTLNVRQLMDSPLGQKDQDQLRQGIKKQAEIQKVLDALGFDPLKDLDSVTVAAAGADAQEDVMIIARGKFDPSKFKAAAEKAAQDHKDALKPVTLDGNPAYEVTIPNQVKPMYAALIDGTTIVASAKKEEVSGAYQVKAGKKQWAVKKELQGLLDKSNPKQSISVVALGSALGNGVPFGEKIEHINGGVTLAEDIQTNFVISTKDAEAATGIAELLRQGLEQGKQMVSLFAQQQKQLAPLSEIIDVLKVDAKDNTVTVKGQVTKETVEKLKQP
jgi:hypothetical protein